jgi:116 kDa U5 small nuclear ribonucleoprotein component
MPQTRQRQTTVCTIRWACLFFITPWWHCRVADQMAAAAQVDPVRNNVAFTSAQSGWSFTLQSFAQLYADVFGTAFDTTEFARRLWGDVYFHPDSEWQAALHARLALVCLHPTSVQALIISQPSSSWFGVSTGRTFKRKPPAGGAERTFVSFILEPLYKIYSQVRLVIRSSLHTSSPQ